MSDRAEFVTARAPRTRIVHGGIDYLHMALQGYVTSVDITPGELLAVATAFCLRIAMTLVKAGADPESVQKVLTVLAQESFPQSLEELRKMSAAESDGSADIPDTIGGIPLPKMPKERM